MTIAVKRAYEPPEQGDGHRVLVDRLWPRGVSAEQLEVDEWLKEIAPSESLRTSFHRGQTTWGDFRRRYLSELKLHRGELQRLARIARGGRLTLVFGAHDAEHNNAVVLMQYLKLLRAD